MKTLQTKPKFEKKANSLLVRAPAKLNLSLLISHKRPDGFHQLETVMAKLAFYDSILIEHSEKPGLDFRVKGGYKVPENQDNLVCKVYNLLMEETGRTCNLKITLTKNIPTGAGLAGGSSDAAAVLAGLNRFLALGLKNDKLMDIAGQLGSDIPFFLGSNLALCSGRGEKLNKLKKNFDFFAILLLPDIIISTKEAYENFVPNRRLYEKLKTMTHKNIGKGNISSILQAESNMLAETVFSLHPELDKLRQTAESLTNKPFYLTGSGSALFTIFPPDQKQQAQKTGNILNEGVSCKSVIAGNNRW